MKHNKISGFGDFFFIITFTLIIIMFSISMSAFKIQNDKHIKYSPNNNKSVKFISSVDYSIQDFEKILEKRNISVILKKHTLNGLVETYMSTKGVYYKEDMKSGSFFDKSDYRKISGNCVLSATFGDSLNIDYINGNGNSLTMKFNVQGISFEKYPKAIISYIDFVQLYGENILQDATTNIVLSGEEEEVKLAIQEIEATLKSKNKDNSLEVNDFMEVDIIEEAKATIKLTILMLAIVFINSIALAYLWIQERKKEFVLRKVVGGTSVKIVKLFAKDLSKLVCISAIISFIIQGILSVISKGYIYNIPIKLSSYSIISIALTSIIVLLITLIPFMYYLSSIQPKEILMEE
ncbi:MAG: FtsX-like permease family protein [Clostridium sp.]